MPWDPIDLTGGHSELAPETVRDRNLQPELRQSLGANAPLRRCPQNLRPPLSVTPPVEEIHRVHVLAAERVFFPALTRPGNLPIKRLRRGQLVDGVTEVGGDLLAGIQEQVGLASHPGEVLSEFPSFLTAADDKRQDFFHGRHARGEKRDPGGA